MRWHRFLVAAIAALTVAFSLTDRALAIGDPPIWPGQFNVEPAISSGCWKWNWYQRSWYDSCPAYVHPKAFLYSRSPIVRARG